MSVIEEVTAKDIKLYKNSPKAHLTDNKIIVKISPQFYCDLESVGFDFQAYIDKRVYFQALTTVKLKKANKYDTDYNFSINRETLILKSANLIELIIDKNIQIVEMVDT